MRFLVPASAMLATVCETALRKSCSVSFLHCFLRHNHHESSAEPFLKAENNSRHTVLGYL